MSEGQPQKHMEANGWQHQMLGLVRISHTIQQGEAPWYPEHRSLPRIKVIRGVSKDTAPDQSHPLSPQNMGPAGATLRKRIATEIPKLWAAHLPYRLLSSLGWFPGVQSTVPSKSGGDQPESRLL